MEIQLRTSILLSTIWESYTSTCILEHKYHVCILESFNFMVEKSREYMHLTVWAYTAQNILLHQFDVIFMMNLISKK
jgi:hypothetical protein